MSEDTHSFNLIYRLLGAKLSQKLRVELLNNFCRQRKVDLSPSDIKYIILLNMNSSTYGPTGGGR